MELRQKQYALKTQRRMSLIEGQVTGIRKMLTEQRDCLEIVQQIVAVRAALAKVGVEILRDESLTCAKTKNTEELERTLDSVFKLS